MPEAPASSALPPRPARAGGLSVRWRLTLSYAALVAVTGAVLLGVVALWLLRYVPDGTVYNTDPIDGTSWAPNRSDIIRAFVPPATWALLGLIAIGVLGGWLLAGRVLRPLALMAETAQAVGDGDLDARIALPGRDDEFRRLRRCDLDVGLAADRHAVAGIGGHAVDCDGAIHWHQISGPARREGQFGGLPLRQRACQHRGIGVERQRVGALVLCSAARQH